MKYFKLLKSTCSEDVAKIPLAAMHFSNEAMEAFSAARKWVDGKPSPQFSTVGELLAVGRDGLESYLMHRAKLPMSERDKIIYEAEEKLARVGLVYPESEFTVGDVRLESLNIPEEMKAAFKRSARFKTIDDVLAYGQKRTDAYLRGEGYTAQVFYLYDQLALYGVKCEGSSRMIMPEDMFTIDEFVSSPEKRSKKKRSQTRTSVRIGDMDRVTDIDTFLKMPIGILGYANKVIARLEEAGFVNIGSALEHGRAVKLLLPSGGFAEAAEQVYRVSGLKFEGVEYDIINGKYKFKLTNKHMVLGENAYPVCDLTALEGRERERVRAMTPREFGFTPHFVDMLAQYKNMGEILDAKSELRTVLVGDAITDFCSKMKEYGLVVPRRGVVSKYEPDKSKLLPLDFSQMQIFEKQAFIDLEVERLGFNEATLGVLKRLNIRRMGDFLLYSEGKLRQTARDCYNKGIEPVLSHYKMELPKGGTHMDSAEADMRLFSIMSTSQKEAFLQRPVSSLPIQRELVYRLSSELGINTIGELIQKPKRAIFALGDAIGLRPLFNQVAFVGLEFKKGGVKARGWLAESKPLDQMTDEEKERFLATPIAALKISEKALTRLKNGGLFNIGQLATKTQSELVEILQFGGERIVSSIRAQLEPYGIKLERGKEIIKPAVKVRSNDPATRFHQMVSQIGINLPKKKYLEMTQEERTALLGYPIAELGLTRGKVFRLYNLGVKDVEGLLLAEHAKVVDIIGGEIFKVVETRLAEFGLKPKSVVDSEMSFILPIEDKRYESMDESEKQAFLGTRIYALHGVSYEALKSLNAAGIETIGDLFNQGCVEVEHLVGRRASGKIKRFMAHYGLESYSASVKAENLFFYINLEKKDIKQMTPEESEKLLSYPLEKTGLTKRAVDAFREKGISTVRELITCSYGEVSPIVASKVMTAIRVELKEFGLSLRDARILDQQHVVINGAGEPIAFLAMTDEQQKEFLSIKLDQLHGINQGTRKTLSDMGATTVGGILEKRAEVFKTLNPKVARKLSGFFLDYDISLRLGKALTKAQKEEIVNERYPGPAAVHKKRIAKINIVIPALVKNYLDMTEDEKQHILNIPIEELGLSDRRVEAAKQNGMTTLVDLLMHTMSELFVIIGQKETLYLKKEAEKYGLRIRNVFVDEGGIYTPIMPIAANPFDMTEEEKRELCSLPLKYFNGFHPKSLRKLEAANIHTLGDLAQCDYNKLEEILSSGSAWSLISIMKKTGVYGMKQEKKDPTPGVKVADSAARDNQEMKDLLDTPLDELCDDEKALAYFQARGLWTLGSLFSAPSDQLSAKEALPAVLKLNKQLEKFGLKLNVSEAAVAQVKSPEAGSKAAVMRSLAIEQLAIGFEKDTLVALHKEGIHQFGDLVDSLESVKSLLTPSQLEEIEVMAKKFNIGANKAEEKSLAKAEDKHGAKAEKKQVVKQNKTTRKMGKKGVRLELNVDPSFIPSLPIEALHIDSRSIKKLKNFNVFTIGDLVSHSSKEYRAEGINFYLIDSINKILAPYGYGIYMPHRNFQKKEKAPPQRCRGNIIALEACPLDKMTPEQKSAFLSYRVEDCHLRPDFKQRLIDGGILTIADILNSQYKQLREITNNYSITARLRDELSTRFGTSMALGRYKENATDDPLFKNRAIDEEMRKPENRDRLLSTPLSALDMNPTLIKRLKEAGILTLGDLISRRNVDVTKIVKNSRFVPPIVKRLMPYGLSFAEYKRAGSKKAPRKKDLGYFGVAEKAFDDMSEAEQQAFLDMRIENTNMSATMKAKLIAAGIDDVRTLSKRSIREITAIIGGAYRTLDRAFTRYGLTLNRHPYSGRNQDEKNIDLFLSKKLQGSFTSLDELDEQRRQEILALSVDELALGDSYKIRLKRAGINTLGDLLKTPMSEIARVTNGHTFTYEHLPPRLAKYGMKLTRTKRGRKKKTQEEIEAEWAAIRSEEKKHTAPAGINLHEGLRDLGLAALELLPDECFKEGSAELANIEAELAEFFAGRMEFLSKYATSEVMLNAALARIEEMKEQGRMLIEQKQGKGPSGAGSGSGGVKHYRRPIEDPLLGEVRLLFPSDDHDEDELI